MNYEEMKKRVNRIEEIFDRVNEIKNFLSSVPEDARLKIDSQFRSISLKLGDSVYARNILKNECDLLLEEKEELELDECSNCGVIDQHNKCAHEFEVTPETKYADGAEYEVICKKCGRKEMRHDH